MSSRRRRPLCRFVVCCFLWIFIVDEELFVNAVTSPCFEETNLKYELVEDKLSFANAKDYCVGLGGVLACFQDPAENARVISNLLGPHSDGISTDIRLGVEVLPENDGLSAPFKFSWVDGATFSFLDVGQDPWAPSEPDDKKNKDCVAWSKNFDFGWTSVLCNPPLPFVCMLECSVVISGYSPTNSPVPPPTKMGTRLPVRPPNLRSVSDTQRILILVASVAFFGGLLIMYILNKRTRRLTVEFIQPVKLDVQHNHNFNFDTLAAVNIPRQNQTDADGQQITARLLSSFPLVKLWTSAVAEPVGARTPVAKATNDRETTTVPIEPLGRSGSAVSQQSMVSLGRIADEEFESL